MKLRSLAAVCAAFMTIPCAALPASSYSCGSECAQAVSGSVFGDFEYGFLSDDTVEITKYLGSAESVVIPDSINGKRVAYIGWNAFKECETIKRVTLPSGNVTVGKWAFFCCKNLERVTMPRGVCSISAYAFAGCESLSSVILPDTVRSIGESAFAGCPALKRAEIPGSVVSIADWAFYNCPDLTIFCTGESEAQRFAGKNSIPAVLLPDGIVGDVDLDKAVTSADALLVLRMSVGLEDMDEDRLRFADVNFDSEADSSDALEILRISAGLE